MDTIVHLFSLNWTQLFMLGVIVIFFVKKEQFLSRIREQKVPSTGIQKTIMTVGIALIGLAIILIGDLHLAAERSKHQRELTLKQAELKLLKAEIADLKAETP